MMTSPQLAPIVLFVYNRLDHTRLAIEALQKNTLASKSLLYIFSDGPKTDQDTNTIEKLRRYLRTIDGFQDVILFEREKNLGLASSIIDGVSTVVKRHGRVIVLEDDLLSSPYFLHFMNQMLQLYADDPMIASVSGYMFPVGLPKEEHFFLPMIGSWGWATWEESWELFEADGSQLLSAIQNRKLQNDFDLDQSYPYIKMLKQQVAGKNDSWAIRWYASLFLSGCYSIWPGQAYVENIGFDGSGTHCKVAHYSESADIVNEKIEYRKRDVYMDVTAYTMITTYLRKSAQMHFKIFWQQLAKKLLPKR